MLAPGAGTAAVGVAPEEAGAVCGRLDNLTVVEMVRTTVLVLVVVPDGVTVAVTDFVPEAEGLLPPEPLPPSVGP